MDGGAGKRWIDERKGVWLIQGVNAFWPLLFLGMMGMLEAEPVKRPEPKSPRELLRELTRDPSGDLTIAARALLGKNGGNSLFYFPTPDPAETPKTWGSTFEDVWFDSTNGVRLHGWFLRSTRSVAKGTVVFSHGNAGAIGHHLGFVMWLLPEGYNVFLYDYRGFGSSRGEVARKGLIEDVQAAFRYVKSRSDVDGKKLISMGHSLGGAKSIVALAENPVSGVRAVVSDAAFASYQGMAEVMAGNLGGNIVSDEWSPKDWVAKLAPVPLLVVHGTDDEVVPLAQGVQLFAAAAEPKTFFTVKGGHHGDALWMNQGQYRRKVLEWLEERMK